MVKMQVLLTKINPKSKSALIMLVDLQKKRVLPIRTGIMEGLARLLSGDLGLNGAIIGGLLVLVGVGILLTTHFLSKRDEK